MTSIRRARIFAAAFLFFLTVSMARAQEGDKGSEADVAAIKQVFADFYGAFSQQDAHATAMTFAEDGDFTNMSGIHVHGREAIEKRFEGLFRGTLRGTSRTDTVRTIHFYTPNVALVDADTVITGTREPDGSVGSVRKGLMIAVMTKHDGRWYIGNFHEAEYPQRPPPPK